MPAPQGRTLGIQDYLIILSNRFYVILVCLAASMTVFGMYAVVAPNRYTASNYIEVKVRSEEPLRQPLVRSSSFQRRFGLMKRRLTDGPGLRSLIAATEHFNCDYIGVRADRVRFLLEKIDQSIREEKERAEREWNQLRAPVNETDNEQSTQVAKQAYEDAQIVFRQAQLLFSKPASELDKVAERIQKVKLVPFELLVEPGLLIAGMSPEMDSTDATPLTALDSVEINKGDRTQLIRKLRTAWTELVEDLKGYNLLRQYEAIEAEARREGVKDEDLSREIDARIAADPDRVGGKKRVELLRSLDEEKTKLGTYIDIRGKLAENLTITTRGSNQIFVSFTSQERAVASDVVNNIVDRFKMINLRIQEEEIKDAVQVLQNEVNDMEQVVASLRTEIIEYGSSYPDVFADSPRQNLAQTTVNTGNENQQLAEWRDRNERLLGMMEDRRAFEQRLSLLRERLAITPESVHAEDIQARSGERARLDSYMHELRFERIKLLTDSTADHPRIKAIDQELRELTRRIDSIPVFVTESIKLRPNAAYVDLQGQINELSVEIEGLQTREDMLREQVRQSYDQLKNLPKKVVELQELQNKYDLARQRLVEYQQSLKTAETTKRLELDKEGTIFEVAEPTSPPSRPSSPNRVLIMLMGLMVGGVMTLSMIFILEYLDHSIKDISDAQRYLRMPVLGVISEFTVVERVVQAKRSMDPFSDSTSKTGPAGPAGLDGDRRTFWERFMNRDTGAKLWLLVGLGLYVAASGKGFFNEDPSSRAPIYQEHTASQDVMNISKSGWDAYTNWVARTQTGTSSPARLIESEPVAAPSQDIPELFSDALPDPVSPTPSSDAAPSPEPEVQTSQAPPVNVKLIFDSKE